jgi:tetratricopeptide (TPR) repeat protein
VDAVKEIQANGERLGLVDAVQAGLAVAAALEAAGRPDDARASLTALLERDLDADARTQDVHQRLGELSLRNGKLEEARASFEAALEIARGRKDAGRSAELEARLAVLALVDGDKRSCLDHLRAARDEWSSAGAVDPAGPLEADLRGLSQAERSVNGSELVETAVEQALDYLRNKLDPAVASNSLAPATTET